jgi:hypothetical protein
MPSFYVPPPRRFGGGLGLACAGGRLAGAERVAGLASVGRAPLVVGRARVVVVVVGREGEALGRGRLDGALHPTGALRVTGDRRGATACVRVRLGATERVGELERCGVRPVLGRAVAPALRRVAEDGRR